MLKERQVNLNSKIADDSDSDLYSLRNEDQFLYDQLSSEDKETVDQLVAHGVTNGSITSDPDLNILYNSLTPEVQSLVHNRIRAKSNQATTVVENDYLIMDIENDDLTNEYNNPTSDVTALVNAEDSFTTNTTESASQEEICVYFIDKP